MCWQGEPEHLQLLQHSQFCLLNLSGDQRLQATPDCTNNHIHGHWHTHTTKLTRTTERTWRYHGIQMRAFRLETEPKVARTATWHRLQAALNRNITHLSTNSFHLFFLLSSKTRSDLLCTCKNSHWLYFVGSVDYTFHLPCLLAPSEYTGISIWNPQCSWQHRHSKRFNLQPWSHRCFWHSACSHLSPHRACILYSVKIFTDIQPAQGLSTCLPTGERN